jgi:beta-galactosidase/beta-glucuronidase
MYSKFILMLTFIGIILMNNLCIAQNIPLPEHPRPDFERDQWINLNGVWQFEFDSLDIGLKKDWNSGNTEFSKNITVPFPWGSKLSGIEDEADIGWYKRDLKVQDEWKNKRTFITIGASDWETTVWLDGNLLGSHQGGYVPFSFELTGFLKYGKQQKLVIRADDKRRVHTLYGKQGYGNARGIWQTVYLEARGEDYIETIHFTPDIDNKRVEVIAYLAEPVLDEKELQVKIKGASAPLSGTVVFKKGQSKARTTISIPNQRLWTLDDPYLYNVEATYGDDLVRSYFGMRKIGVENLPGTDIPYIALNNEPIYLQLALDQSYHPDGYYTFPNDQFIIDEIKRSKSIGLNGIRTHIKVEVPRKLYWADKLGLLVMEDLPNSWGEPEELMQLESTYTLREMIKRDYNHPSIFSWVIINETWGMRTRTKEGKEYLPETQRWLVSMYHLAKSLDPSRLVEDNSICCGIGHTVTDINSWHVYLPGYEWDDYLSNLSDSTFAGSEFNYEKGFTQGSEPNINSECGNVWGYEGSTGDVDWSWDYHRMINSFRMYPKIGGWLYTEHHDVINEWNGYWRFDRSEKFTGF